MTGELINPNSKKGQKIDRTAKARIDIDYLDLQGEKRTLHYEMNLEPPIAPHPSYKIGIGEL